MYIFTSLAFILVSMSKSASYMFGWIQIVLGILAALWGLWMLYADGPIGLQKDIAGWFVRNGVINAPLVVAIAMLAAGAMLVHCRSKMVEPYYEKSYNPNDVDDAINAQRASYFTKNLF